MADELVSPTPQFPSTMQITDFKLSEVDFFHVLQNETLLQTLMYFIVPMCLFIKNKLSCL